jgi:tetratricopeptide (TPR) repeat protein
VLGWGWQSFATRVWDAATGEAVTPLLRHQNGVEQALFTPDGSRVVTKSSGLVRAWELAREARPVEDLLALAHLLSARRVDETGGLVSVESKDLRVAWQELLSRSLRDDSSASREQRLAWHWLTAQDCSEAEEWAGAILNLDRLIEAEPRSWRFHEQRGRAWAELTRWDAALRDYSRAIELGGDTVDLWHRRSLVHFHLGNREQAAADFANAIERGASPETVCGHLWQWAAAVRGLDRLIRARPREWILYARRARAYAELGQWEPADIDLVNVTDLDKEGLWSSDFEYHALARLKAGNLAAYRRLCEKLVAAVTDETRPWAVKAVAWTCVLVPDAVRDHGRVVGLTKQALTNDPKDYDLLKTLGAALYRAGRFEAAIETLDEAVKAQSEGGTAHDWLFLAMAHRRLGHNAEARNWLEKAVNWINQAAPDAPRDDARPALLWTRRLELQLLRREAEALLRDGNKDP